jgi:hypothetical protein
MKFKMQKGAEDIEATFRISSMSREFDAEPRGGYIIRAWRCPTERESAEDAETLTLILEEHEFERFASMLPRAQAEAKLKAGT